MTLTLDKTGRFVDEDNDEESKADGSSFPEIATNVFREDTDKLDYDPNEESDIVRDLRIMTSEPKKKVHRVENFAPDPRWKNRQVYLLGNPIVWWSVTAVLGIRFLIEIVKFIVGKRKIQLFDFGNVSLLYPPPLFLLYMM